MSIDSQIVRDPGGSGGDDCADSDGWKNGVLCEQTDADCDP